MKKLLFIAVLIMASHMQAMQMGDGISNNVRNKTPNSSCCGTAAKAFCLGALLASGQVQGQLEAGNVAAGHAGDLDGPGIVGIAGMCSNLGTAFMVAGVSDHDLHPSKNLIIVAAASPGFISSCLADVYSKHSLRPFCEEGSVAQCYDRDERAKEKKD